MPLRQHLLQAGRVSGFRPCTEGCDCRRGRRCTLGWRTVSAEALCFKLFEAALPPRPNAQRVGLTA